MAKTKAPAKKTAAAKKTTGKKPAVKAKAPVKKAASKSPVKKIQQKKSAVKKSASKVVTKKSAPGKKSTVPKKPLKVNIRNIKSRMAAALIKPVEIIVPQKKYKPNKKVRYTLTELKAFKEIIIEERNMILESAKANMRSLVDNESGDYVGDNSSYSTHMAEQGTDEMEREKNYMFVQRDEKYLGFLQDALVRIDNGTYGVCNDCTDEHKNLCRSCPLIPKERLELVPITQHCIECKNMRG
ncbi:hypothetical protein BH10BAC5_BH10BAC5_27030 [soil metagenome]